MVFQLFLPVQSYHYLWFSTFGAGTLSASLYFILPAFFIAFTLFDATLNFPMHQMIFVDTETARLIHDKVQVMRAGNVPSRINIK